MKALSYIVIFISSFVAAIPLIITIKDAIKKRSSLSTPEAKKKQTKIIRSSWTSIIAVFILFFFLTWEKCASNKEADEDRDTATARHDTIISKFKADSQRLSETNAALRETKADLLGSIHGASDEMINKINQSGENVINNLNELNNRVTGGNGLVFFCWEKHGARPWTGTIYNPNKYPLELLYARFTDYNALKRCYSERSAGSFKIDEDCYNRWTLFLPDTLNPQFSSFTVPYPKWSLSDYYMTKQVGLFLLEIEFSLKNGGYYEQLAYQIEPNKMVFQSARLVSSKWPYKVLKKIPSSNKQFEAALKWDTLFNLPRKRIYYHFK